MRMFILSLLLPFLVILSDYGITCSSSSSCPVTSQKICVECCADPFINAVNNQLKKNNLSQLPLKAISIDQVNQREPRNIFYSFDLLSIICKEFNFMKVCLEAHCSRFFDSGHVTKMWSAVEQICEMNKTDYAEVQICIPPHLCNTSYQVAVDLLMNELPVAANVQALMKVLKQTCSYVKKTTECVIINAHRYCSSKVAKMAERIMELNYVSLQNIVATVASKLSEVAVPEECHVSIKEMIPTTTPAYTVSRPYGFDPKDTSSLTVPKPIPGPSVTMSPVIRMTSKMNDRTNSERMSGKSASGTPDITSDANTHVPTIFSYLIILVLISVLRHE